MTPLSTKFKQNTLITKFDELERFYNITSLGTNLSTNAFYGCNHLTSVIIPKEVTSLYSVFLGCSNLIHVNLNNVTAISGATNYECFRSCRNLSDIDFRKVKTIDYQSFYGCSSLQRIYFANIESIERNSFVSCSGIQYVVVDTETIPSVGDSNGGAFPTGSFSFYVHDDLVESFKTTGQWTRYKTRIKPLSEFITAYPDDAEELGLV